MKPGGPRVLVFGEVLFDRFADGSVVLGGAAFNVAWNLRGLGAAPLLVSRVGDDALGERVRDAMESWGLETSGLQIDPRRPTGVVDVQLGRGEPSYDIVADTAYDCIELSEIPAEAPDVALLVHGTLALRAEPSRSTFERLARTVRAAAFCDVNLRAPWWDGDRVRQTLNRARIVKLNEAELSALAPGANDEAARIRRMLSLGPEIVLLTRGAKGASVHSADGCLARVAPTGRERVVDAVGAGDAFASVFVLGHLRGWGVEQTMRRAQQFACAVVGRRGAIVEDEAFYRVFDWT